MFKRKFKGLLFFIIVLSLLASCGSAEEDTLMQYSVSNISLQEEVSPASRAVLLGEDILILEDNNSYYILHTLRETAERVFEASPQITVIESTEPILNFTKDEEGLLVLTLDDDFLGVCRVSESGELSCGEKINVTDIVGSSEFGIVGSAISSSGAAYLVLAMEDLTYRIIGCDSSGELLFDVSHDEVISDIVQINGDTLLLLSNGDKLETLDPNDGTLMEEISLDKSYTKLYGGEGAVLYLDDGESLYEYNFVEAQTRRILDWATVGTQSPRWLLSLGEDTFVIHDHMNLQVLSPMSGEALADNREILTLATMSAPSVATEVWEFNSTNEQYKIEVLEYGQDGAERLIADIGAGEVPDIFYFGGGYFDPRVLSSQDLASGGYLMDLYEFIDVDEELSRENFLPNILSMAETEGHLYEMPYAFMIICAAVDASIVGDKTSWTVEEMLYILDTQNYGGYLLGPQSDRLSVLHQMFSYNLTEYVDWSSGTCSFDTAEFRQLLEAIYRYAPPEHLRPTETEQELIWSGKQLMKREFVGGVTALQEYDFYFETPVLIGFPTEEGSGNIVEYDGSFSISSSAQHADAAWSFVRQHYVVDYYEEQSENFSFPVNSEAFELKLSSDESGGIFTFYNSDDTTFQVTYDKPTEEEIAEARALISSATKVSRVNPHIFDIVWEEASAYFEGTQSLDEAVSFIQSRVSLYMAEQG